MKHIEHHIVALMRAPAAQGGIAGGIDLRTGQSSLQAGYQLDIPLMFAALLLISLAGIALFGVMSWVSRRALSAWHESEAVQSH